MSITVNLLTSTPNAEKVVAAAAKLCYSKSGASEIMENLDDEKVKDFIQMLCKSGHMSPFEHASYTFAIEGISRVATHQLVRHRLASYSQQSQKRPVCQRNVYGASRISPSMLFETLLGIRNITRRRQIYTAPWNGNADSRNYERKGTPALLLSQPLQKSSVGNKGNGKTDAYAGTRRFSISVFCGCVHKGGSRAPYGHVD